MSVKTTVLGDSDADSRDAKDTGVVRSTDEQTLSRQGAQDQNCPAHRQAAEYEAFRVLQRRLSVDVLLPFCVTKLVVLVVLRLARCTATSGYRVQSQARAKFIWKILSQQRAQPTQLR